MGIVASVNGMIFFPAVFHVLDLSFLVLHFDGNVCSWIPVVIWSQMDQFWGFFRSKMVSFNDIVSLRSEICKDCSIVFRL